jgi:hypothetical protein
MRQVHEFLKCRVGPKLRPGATGEETVYKALELIGCISEGYLEMSKPQE